MINLRYCDTANFGDKLSPDVVKFVSKDRQVLCRKVTDPTPALVAVGSILHTVASRDIVWGTGAMTARPWQQAPTDLTVCAVRGPLTRYVLLGYGVSCPSVYGDPACLLPLIYGAAPNKTHRLGIVLHYADRPKWTAVQALQPHALIIDVTRSIRDVVIDITRCDAILSSSLHGLIAAEAYGIPAGWIEFDESVAGAGFKFLDYYAGSGRGATAPCAVDRPAYTPAAVFDTQKLINAFPRSLCAST